MKQRIYAQKHPLHIENPSTVQCLINISEKIKTKIKSHEKYHGN